MRRRDFITLVGGAVAWPMAAGAQTERMRRIGVLMGAAADEPETQARFAAFVRGMQQLGLTDGRNVRIDTLWGTNDAERLRRGAAQLIARGPDVVLAGVGGTIPALQQASGTTPIVFAQG